MKKEHLVNWEKRTQNEPKTNPNEPKLKKAKMNVNKVLTKDYENKSNWALFENEPNQTQFKSNLLRRSLWRSRKQTQFQRQKNPALHHYAVGYLRKKCYSVTLLTGNLRLISHLIAMEKVK